MTLPNNLSLTGSKISLQSTHSLAKPKKPGLVEAIVMTCSFIFLGRHTLNGKKVARPLRFLFKKEMAFLASASFLVII